MSSAGCHLPTHPQVMLDFAFSHFKGKVVYLSAFNSIGGAVLIHMIAKMDVKKRRPFTVVALDTGKLHRETYEFIERCERCYAPRGITIKRIHPDPAAVAKMIAEAGGDEEFYRRSVELRERCCFVRKVGQFREAVAGCDAWISGLRPGSIGRESVPLIEKDSLHGGIWKINPLADCTEKFLADYVHEYEVPHNPLLDQDYEAPGCECCTRPLTQDERESGKLRAGRWWWEDGDRKECGLHARPVAEYGGNIVQIT